MLRGSRFVIAGVLFLGVFLSASLAPADPLPSCAGTDACSGNTGEVGEGTCNGSPDPISGKGACEI